MATPKTLLLALGTAGALGAGAAGWLLLRRAPAPVPVVPRQDQGIPVTVANGGLPVAPLPGKDPVGGPKVDEDDDDERDPDPTAPVGGAAAEDILHAAAKGNWIEVERLLSIAGSDDPRVTQLILDALKDGQHRVQAARLAKYLKDPSALARILELAKTPGDDNTRSAALEAAAHIGGEGVFEAASDALRTAKPGGILYSSAAASLGTLGTPEAARTLVDLLRTAAGTPREGMLVEAFKNLKDPETLAEIGRMVNDAGQDAALRVNLLQALGQTKQPGVVPDLLKAARETDSEAIRAAAYAGLASVGSPDAAQELMNVVQGADDGRKAAAAAALQGLRSRAAGPVLAEALAGPMPEALRPYVVEALGHCGGKEAVAPLSKILGEGGEGSEGMRTVAVRALGRIGDPSAGKHIVDAMEAAPKGEAAFFHEAAGALVNTATVEDLPRLERMQAAMQPEKDPDWFILRQVTGRLQAEKALKK